MEHTPPLIAPPGRSRMPGLGVGAIALVPVAMAGAIAEMQQRDAVAQALEFAAPVMGRAAGLQEDLGAGRWAKKGPKAARDSRRRS